jgi:hypothetical protein
VAVTFPSGSAVVGAGGPSAAVAGAVPHRVDASVRVSGEVEEPVAGSGGPSASGLVADVTGEGSDGTLSTVVAEAAAVAACRGP